MRHRHTYCHRDKYNDQNQNSNAHPSDLSKHMTSCVSTKAFWFRSASKTILATRSSAPAPAHSHRLRERDELVEGLAPPVVEAHVRVLFGACFVAVDRDGGVFRAAAMRFEQDYRGKERHAG